MREYEKIKAVSKFLGDGVKRWEQKKGIQKILRAKIELRYFEKRKIDIFVFLLFINNNGNKERHLILVDDNHEVFLNLVKQNFNKC